MLNRCITPFPQNDTIPGARTVAVIGSDPAGLMAAEALIQGGVRVDLYDAMPSVECKFLLVGKGAMSIIYTEPIASFHSRCGARRKAIIPLLAALEDGLVVVFKQRHKVVMVVAILNYPASA